LRQLKKIIASLKKQVLPAGIKKAGLGFELIKKASK